MKRLFTALVSCLLTASVLETAGLFIFKNQYNWNHRYSFITTDSFRIIDERLWTYRPNSTIKVAAVYGFPFGTPWVEYDCEFQTNRFGLIQTNPIELDSYDLLVLGDSFTEGQGGCPWLTTETTRSQGLRIINGGLQSTGIAAFANLERYLSAQVDIKSLLVIAISDDFIRKTPSSAWIEKGTPCLIHRKCNNTNYWWSIDSDVRTDHLEKMGRSRIVQRYEAQDVRGKFEAILDQVAWRSFTGRLLAAYYEIVGDLTGSSENLHQLQGRFEPNIKALQFLKRKYPNMRLILVPQRDELGLFGGRNQNTRRVEERLDALVIDYERCELLPDDFMYIDGHPNEQGYRKLRDCAFGDTHAERPGSPQHG